MSKTEPAVVVKTEASSVLLTQQQTSHVTHSQQQQTQPPQPPPNVHIKQQPQQHNIVQQTHAQQVAYKQLAQCSYIRVIFRLDKITAPTFNRTTTREEITCI